MLKARAVTDVEYYLRRARGCGEDRTAYYLGREESAGRWVGGRAEEFGLVGELDRGQDHDTFRRLVTGGILPGSDQRASQYRHKVKGWDLCTSAPKSVSLLSALGDPAVSAAAVDAHKAATAAALSYLESLVNEVRRGDGGKDRQPAVPGLIGVAFRHREARPCKGCDHGDPQLHTHTVIANIQPGCTAQRLILSGSAF
jgi:conjugative relaxase-like TrwC/TraI family protein